MVARSKYAADSSVHQSAVRPATSSSSAHIYNTNKKATLPSMDASGGLSSVNAGAKSMLPPSSLPPIRTATKTKPSATGKETASSRPAKKMAKEQSGAQTPQHSGNASRMIATASKPPSSSSRGNSSSPHSASPIQSDRDVRVPSMKIQKKPDVAVPGKSRLAPPGSFQRQLETQGRSARANNASILGVPVKGKCAISGVESVAEMDESESVRTPSTSHGELIPVLTSNPTIHIQSENVPPNMSESDARYVHQIHELEERLQNLSSVEEETKKLREEKATITEDYNVTLRELQILTAESQKFKADHGQCAELNQILLEETRSLKTQVENLQAAYEEGETMRHLLSEENNGLRGANELQVKEIERLTADSATFVSRLDELIAHLAKARAEKDVAELKAASVEERVARLQRDHDSTSKEVCSLKKKRGNDKEKYVEEVAALQKSIQTKEDEARSWESVTQLKAEKIRELQKDLEDARAIVEKHAICEAETSRQDMKIASLENKIRSCAAEEQVLRKEINDKDLELRTLRRQSLALTQEKDTLRYKLDELVEQDEEGSCRAKGRRSMLTKEPLIFQLDRVGEPDDEV